MTLVTKSKASWLTVIAILAFWSCARNPSVPVYQVFRTTIPIQVDGRLDESAWTKAPLVADLVTNLEAKPGTPKTQIKILYDDTFLYFAFRCEDENIWATLKQRDAHLWEEEAVEVFLQADPRQPDYIELEVNPLGTILDIYLRGARKPLHFESWNSEELRWAVQVNGTVDGKGGDKEWTCEIALPMEDIVTAPNLPPRAGDRWRLNLYRIEKMPHAAYLAWSPTFEDFHVPTRFGEIVFTNQQVP
jgi:Carbohydrate-binding family 9